MVYSGRCDVKSSKSILRHLFGNIGSEAAWALDPEAGMAIAISTLRLDCGLSVVPRKATISCCFV